MESIRRQTPQATLMSLEAAAASARGGFACLFSTADEYETAVIIERRAQGRYAAGRGRSRDRGRWPLVLFAACALTVAAIVLMVR
jgi:hypothetical protein